jgi:hypothetical protein
MWKHLEVNETATDRCGTYRVLEIIRDAHKRTDAYETVTTVRYSYVKEATDPWTGQIFSPDEILTADLEEKDNAYVLMQADEQRRGQQLAATQKKHHVKATITNAPCVASCWNATGNICACSCGGENHGIGHDPVQELRAA